MGRGLILPPHLLCRDTRRYLSLVIMPDAPRNTILVAGGTGKSAYEIAREHGFTGTEQEWIDSLTGSQGVATTLINRGNWTIGEIYRSNEYVFADATVGSGTSAYLVKSLLPFISITQPKLDSVNWMEMLASGENINISFTNGTEKGIKQLVSGQDYIDVEFVSGQLDSDWILAATVANTVDADALNLFAGSVTDKSETGCRVQLSGMPDSSNYYLDWIVVGTGFITGPATTYLFSGPTTGEPLVASTNFTVRILAGQTLASPVTITPHDAGAGGTFTPSTVIISTGTISATFTYTAASTGDKTLSVTNSGGLIDPANITYHSVSAPHLLNGLVSYWDLDEAGGATTLTDRLGTNNLTGSPVSSFAGIINGSVYFSGAATGYTHASSASLQVTTDFFFSFWARNDDNTATFQVAIMKDDFSTLRDYSIYYDGATNGWSFSAGGASVSKGAPETINTWHHLVCWYDSSDQKLRIRIDNATTYTSAGTATLTQTAQQFGLGRTPSFGFTGLIDEVGFWKGRKPTATEITTLYNSGAGTPYGSFTS